MPQIPQYESNSTFPVTGRPRAPMTNPVNEAITRAGSVAENIGAKFAEQDMDLKRMAALSNTLTQERQHILDSKLALQKDPNYLQNPEQAASDWAASMRQYQQQQLEGIKDPWLKAKAQQHFAIDSLDHIYSVREAAQKRAANIAGTSIINDAGKERAMADQEPDPGLSSKAIGRAQALYSTAAKQGFITPVAAEKYSRQSEQEWAYNKIARTAQSNPEMAAQMMDDDTVGKYLKPGDRTRIGKYIDSHGETLSNRQEKEADKRTLTVSVNHLVTKHQLNSLDGDFKAAYDETQDPEAAAEMGLDTEKKREDAGKAIMGRHANLEKLDKDAGDKTDKKFHNDFLDGKISPDKIAGYKDKTGRRPSDKEITWALDFGTKTDRAKDHTDPAAYADIREKILSGEISKDSEIPREGNGVSIAARKDLVKIQEAMSDPGRSPWLKTAIRNYDKVHENDFKHMRDEKDRIKATAGRDAFITSLSDGSVEGPDLLDKANKIMLQGVKAKPKEPGSEDMELPGEAKQTGKAQASGKLPQPGDTSKFIGFKKGTLHPVYLAPDGHKFVDTTRDLPLVATHTGTGEPLYQLPDGRLVTVNQDRAPKKETEADEPVDYDMDGYRAKYGEPDQSKGQHLTDEFKLPNHMTFSNESKYSKPGQEGGTWEKRGEKPDEEWHFHPSGFNLTQHSAEDLSDYFQKKEKKGTFLHLPDGKILEGEND